MTVAVYVRVSTSSQNEAEQKRDIMKWLTGNGINLVGVQWYIDKDSGQTLKQPEFEKLQRDIFSGAIKTVVVYKLDRLSRSLKDGIDVLCSWCQKGIRVVSTSQQIDFNGPIGQMIAAVLFAVAQFETETRRARRDRQAAGIAVAKEKGAYRGRIRGATKAGVDPARAAELRAKGLTHAEVAKSMGISLSTAFRYAQDAKREATGQ
ncbi:MAG: recombinase family protein [Pirellula sp.]|nr:recombinase family protein [Pirellula sp.]